MKKHGFAVLLSQPFAQSEKETVYEVGTDEQFGQCLKISTYLQSNFV